MVDGEVALLVDGCQLELVRSHLVVTRLHGNTQLEGLYLQVFHERLHALGDGTEVVVIHLLVLRRIVAHQRATCQHKVGTRRVEAFVDEEVFLLPTQIGLHLAYLRIKVVANLRSCDVHGM